MMPLAFLPALQCFISLLHCPGKKSGLLPAGATGDPLPVAEGDASPGQSARGALNLAPEIAAVYWMCLPTAGEDCTWAQSVGLLSLAAPGLGSVCCPGALPAQEWGQDRAPTILSHCVLQLWQRAGGIHRASLPLFPSATWCTTCLERVDAGTSRRRR